MLRTSNKLIQLKIISRSFAFTNRCEKQIKEGFWVVHDRHQLPHWDRNLKISKVRTDAGHVLEMPEYTHKPFNMYNLKGSQPLREFQKVQAVEQTGSNHNTGPGLTCSQIHK